MTRRTSLRASSHSAILLAVARMTLHPQRQRLDAAQRQETVERAGDRADRVLQEFQPVGQILVVADRDAAADHVGMAVQIFRRRMHDEVDAELERPLDVGAAEGVVGDRDHALAPGERRDALKIDDAQQRVGRRFDPQHLRFGPDRRLDRGEVGEVDEARPADWPSACARVRAGGTCRHRCRRWRRHARRNRAARTRCAIAARPEAKAKPAVPLSRSATARSKAKRVGFWLRAYSKPLCTPGLCWP